MKPSMGFIRNQTFGAVGQEEEENEKVRPWLMTFLKPLPSGFLILMMRRRRGMWRNVEEVVGEEVEVGEGAKGGGATYHG